MAFAFAVDVRFHIQNRSFFGVALFHGFDHHRDAVGDFLPQQMQHLLADQLRRQHPFRLVAHHIVGEEVGAVKGVFFQFLQQLVQPLAGDRRYRQHTVKGIHLLPLGNAGEDSAFVGQRVDFVDDQQRG